MISLRTASIVLFEHIIQGELTIGGDYRFNLSLHPTLSMTDVRLVSDSDGYTVQAGHVAIRLHLQRLWSGLIWFENLELNDVSVTVNPPSQKPDGGHWTPDTLFPVFEQAHITNFRIEDKRQAAEFSVTSLIKCKA